MYPVLTERHVGKQNSTVAHHTNYEKKLSFLKVIETFVEVWRT